MGLSGENIMFFTTLGITLTSSISEVFVQIFLLKRFEPTSNKLE